MSPTNYLLCKDGATLMPAVMVGTTEEGLIEVASPQGTVYSAAPANVLSLEEGAQMLRQRRGEQLVAEGYQCMHLRGDRWFVWHPRKHGERGEQGGYCVTENECNCLDNLKGNCCKHRRGLADLIRYAQVQKPTIRMMAIGVVVADRPVSPFRVEVSAEEIERKVAARRAKRLAAAA